MKSLLLWLVIGCKSEPQTGLKWLERVGNEKQSYATLGMETRSYRMVDGFEDPDGLAPVFHVIRPQEAAADRPVLLWLHGSAMGVEDDPELNKNCGRSGVAEEVERLLEHRPAVAAELAGRGWIWVVPEDSWCDLWSGRGAEDPVDSRHYGTVFLGRILDALEQGFDGNRLRLGALYGWGTSIGGMGILHFSALDERFAAVVSDSGPVDPIQWYHQAEASTFLDHILGGPPVDTEGLPTEWSPNYSRLSAPLLVEQGWDLPIFVAYNTLDRLVPASMNQKLVAALEARGGPWYSWDLQRHAPGPLYHVQTGRSRVPGAWVNRAGLDFLEGKSPIWIEAERACLDCPLTTTVGDPGWSGEAAVERQGDGLLFEATLPADLSGKFLEIHPAAVSEGADLSLSLSTSTGLWAETTRSAEQFTGGDLAASWVEQIEATLWRPDVDGDGAPDPLPAGPLTLRVEAKNGNSTLDGVLLVSSD